MSPKVASMMQKAFEKEMDGKWHVTSGNYGPEIGWYYSEDLQRALRRAAEVMIEHNKTQGE